MTTTQSIKHAPEYVAHREGLTAPDAAPPQTNKTLGMATDGYLAAHIQVLPSGGANPSVQVQVWSEALGQFITPVDTDFAQTGAGADTPYEFTIFCRSRRIWVRATALAAGSVDIYVAGTELDHLR